MESWCQAGTSRPIIAFVVGPVRRSPCAAELKYLAESRFVGYRSCDLLQPICRSSGAGQHGFEFRDLTLYARQALLDR